MIDFLSLYGLHVTALLQWSPKCRKVLAQEGEFFLKFYPNARQEVLFQELAQQSLPFVTLPLENSYHQLISEHDGVFFALFPFYEEDDTELEEGKLKFYFSCLGQLHHQTEYFEDVQSSYFDEVLASIEKDEKRMEEQLEKRMEKIEKNSYHSPLEWYWILNYPHLHLALEEVKRRLDLLEEKWTAKPQIRLGIVYGHYEPSHILLKQQKLVSWEAISKNPIVYDFIFMLGQIKNMRMDMTTLFDQYFRYVTLDENEKLWISIYLLLPIFETEGNEIEQIASLHHALKHLYVGEKLVTYFEGKKE